MNLADLIVRRRRRILLAWVALAALMVPGSARLPDRLEASSTISGSESAAVEGILQRRFASSFAQQLVLVVTGLPPANTSDGRHALRRVIERVRDVPGITGVLSHLDRAGPLFVGDGDRGTLVVVGVTPDRRESPDALLDALRSASSAAERELQADHPRAALRWIGTAAVSQDLRRASSGDARRAELRAVPVTLALLLAAFGALVAALLPVMVGMLAIAITLGAATMISMFAPLSILLQSVTSILGLALGVDYALLMVSRFREALAAGCAPREAAVEATRHAGHTILLSGCSVAIGFAALLFVPIPEMRSVAIGGLLIVSTATLLATTLLPAVLSWLGAGVDAGRVFRTTPGHAPVERWRAWGAWVTRHPVLVLVITVIPLAALAYQVRGLSSAVPSNDWLPAGTESARALRDLRAMGRAAVAQRLTVLVQFPPGVDALDSAAWGATLRLSRVVRANPSVAQVTSLPALALGAPLPTPTLVALLPDSVRRRFTSVDRRIALIEVLPRERASPREVTDLVRTLRGLDAASVAGISEARLRVGGLPAYNVDYEDAVAAHLWSVILLVLGGTFVALAVGFRSLLIPLKAIALNLLSVGAAFGALVLVFQDGHGASLFGLDAPLDGVFPAVPVLVFCIVFGLSMDYEVFLVARVAEARRAGYGDREAIAEGLARTGRLITSAAAVMVVVFAAFAFGDYLPAKLLGFTLAVAVVVDATIVRLAIGPALLQLAGKWNWWPEYLPSRSTTIGALDASVGKRTL